MKFIEDNYLQFSRLRHDVISDKLQLRMEKPTPDPSPKGGENSAMYKSFPSGEDLGEASIWREMTKHDINSIVCHCAQECDMNITSREVMTALQSDLIPDVHPLREYILSLPPFTPDQPDWIDWVAQQVRVKPSGEEAKGDKARGEEFWRACFKKWFVAMVASWMKDEVVNHQVLVLIGKQGIYKTTWLEHLIPPTCAHMPANSPTPPTSTRTNACALPSLDSYP